MHPAKYVILSFFVACLEGQAAIIIVDTNVSLTLEGAPNHYGLKVYQDAAGTDPTSIFFDLEGQDLTFTGINPDEGSDWYLVNFGDKFTRSIIDAGVFVTFVKGSEIARTVTVGFGDFYLGLNTGLETGEEEPQDLPVRDVFGWAKLRNSPAGLELLGSAVAYGGAGIIVGTTMLVPEPSTRVLAAWTSFAALFFALRGLVIGGCLSHASTTSSE